MSTLKETSQRDRVATDGGRQARGPTEPGSIDAAFAVQRDIRYRRPYFFASLLNGDNYRRVASVASLALIDIVGVCAALFTAIAVKELILGTYTYDRVADAVDLYAPFTVLVTLLLFARSGLYTHREARPGFSRVIAALFQVSLVSLVFAELNGEHFSSYYIFYGGLLFSAIYVSGLRFAYEKVTGRLLRAMGYKRRAVLVGTGDHIEAVAHALESSVNSQYDAVGFLSISPLESSQGIPSLGQLADLPSRLDEHDIDEVIIADMDFPEEATIELVDQCHRRGVAVRVAPSTMELLVHHGEFVPGQPVPLFELKPPVFEGFDYVVKRTFDFVAAGALTLLLSPVLFACAAMVKLSSRGPVFYRCLRPGVGGEPFECLKFRTMVSSADQLQAELEESNEATGALFKIKDDPRMTPVGRVLRRFSLDELPQLINVVRGDMSLVGPRPLPARDFGRLEEWHKKRYLVLPGITGLWQVSGRSDLDFDDMVRLDFLYLERWSVFLDITILLKTLPAVLRGRGAY